MTAPVDRIVAIVNAAYFWSEAEQWTDEKERTSTPEITDLLKNGNCCWHLRANSSPAW